MMLSFFLLAAYAPATLPQQFDAPRSLTRAAERPGHLQLVDLNGDGFVDVLHGTTAESSPGASFEILWHEGGPDGEFPALHSIAQSAVGFRSVTTGDVDGDGDLDVVAFLVSSPSTEIVLIEALDAGVFGARSTIATIDGVGAALALVDLDGDGDEDVVAASIASALPPGEAAFVLVESLGGGAFASPRDVDAAGAGAFAILGADVDGDGDQDLVVGSESFEPAWYRNDGTLPLTGPVAIASVTPALPFAMADMDGDGFDDVVSLSASERFVQWNPGDGSGGFGAPAIAVLESTELGSVGARDLDLDGAAEVFATLGGVGPVWFDNDGLGSFSGPQLVPTRASCVPGDSALVAGDVDGDGLIDLTVGCLDDRIVWSRNGGASVQRFEEARDVSSHAVGFVQLLVTDIDTDGLVDVVGLIESASGEFPRIAASAGSPEVGLRSVETLLRRTDDPLSIAAGDLDSDGDVDLLISSELARRTLRLDNEGDGTFVEVGQIVNQELWSVVVQDEDGDGDDDILFEPRSGPSGGIDWFEQSGDALLRDDYSASVFLPSMQRLFRIDMDGNDADDLVLLQSEGVGIRYDFRTSSTFSQAVVAPGAPGRVIALEVVDLDADSLPDMIVGEAGGARSLTWFRNLGNTVYDPIALEASNEPLAGMAVVDVDLDGDLDVVGAFKQLPRSADLHLWRNLGGGTFGAPELIAFAPEGFGRLESGDFDGDGDVDLVSLVGPSKDLTLIRNREVGPIGSIECTSLPNSTGSVASMAAFGSTLASRNEVRLSSADVPSGSVGLYLTSLTSGFVIAPGGSLGILCLGGAIGRYVGPGQVQVADADGTFALDLDLSSVPQPNGAVQVVAGETWRFQAWFRDSVGGQATSNFTDGLAIVFR